MKNVALKREFDRWYTENEEAIKRELEYKGLKGALFFVYKSIKK